jgi:hypothetical protein
VKLIEGGAVPYSARHRCARVPTKGPSRLNADGSSAEDDVRTTPVSDTPGRGQTPERACAYREGGRYGWGTFDPLERAPHPDVAVGGFAIYPVDRSRPEGRR